MAKVITKSSEVISAAGLLLSFASFKMHHLPKDKVFMQEKLIEGQVFKEIHVQVMDMKV